MKIHQAVQKLLMGDTQTEQTGDLIRLLSFLESRLKNYVVEYSYNKLVV
jgi:hypothetical protein